jgi:orotate phosphoribosyltransferase
MSLEDIGAVLRGHFLLSSGRHSQHYFEKFRLLERPELLEPLVMRMIEPFREKPIEVVVGPTVGGVLVAYEAAKQFGVSALYAEREEGKRIFRRGATLEPDTHVLVVDDVLTTGLSVREVIELVQSEGGKTIGVGVLIDRSEEPLDFGCPLSSASKLQAETYSPEECPLCQAGIPITKPGSR